MTDGNKRDALHALTGIRSVPALFNDIHKRHQSIFAGINALKGVSIPLIPIPKINIPNFMPPAWTAAVKVPLLPAFDFGLKIQAAWAPFMEEFSRSQRTLRKLDGAGWLPHYTTPLHLLAESEEGNLSALIEAHYQENWSEIKASFLENVSQYNIDDEAKDTFREALQVHELGFYRSVSRTLFPEIERVARAEFHQGEAAITSQHKLREHAGNRYLHEFKPGGMLGMKLFKKLEDHLYVKFDSNSPPETINDSTPNRHATIHGLASYPTHQNSINALIMTDFIFQVIHLSKAEIEEHISEHGVSDT